MSSSRIRRVVAARLLRLCNESENDQAIVAACRTLLEATGALGKGAKSLEEGEQASAVEMSPAAMRRELERLGSASDRKQ